MERALTETGWRGQLARMQPTVGVGRRWTGWLAWAAALGASIAAHASPRGFHEHSGMANASAVAVLGGPWFVVASDESNVLRIYRSDQDGGPAGSLDLSPLAALRGRSDELDLEGGARLGDRVYWVGSHGRSRDGKPRPNRQRLLATRVAGRGEQTRLEPVGEPCTRLLQDLLADPRYAALGLPAATRRAPEQGGVNIEGLAATPDGGLLAGFRSPLVRGKALLAPILNPAEAVQGQPVRLGEPVLLDLGGRGVRDLTWAVQEWFVIGGGVEGAGKPRLYRWKGPGHEPEALKDTGFKHFKPEALASRSLDGAAGLELLVLSDDGGRKAAAATPVFRSFVVTP